MNFTVDIRIMQTINIEEYVHELIKKLQLQFANRLIYVGLQGSFRRNEATENSDIDIMVTLDRLSVADLDRYRAIIAAMPCFNRSCGFICGREELAHWPPGEICQLLHETKDYYGELRPLLPCFERGDIENYIAVSIGNLYHLLCHNRVHAEPEKRADTLRGLYKAVFYILQNSHYLRSGEWIMTKRELLPLLHGLDREALQTAMTIKSASEYDTEQAFAILFEWCRRFFIPLRNKNK